VAAANILSFLIATFWTRESIDGTLSKSHSRSVALFEKDLSITEKYNASR
jgi:hypothetical protein